MRSSWCDLGLLLVLAVWSPAQQGLEDAYRRAQELGPKASAAEVEKAYLEVLVEFLKLDPDSSKYRRWRSVGGYAALLGGRPGVAVDLLGEAIGAGHRDANHVRWRLLALLAARRATEAVAFARAVDVDFPGAVRAVVVGDRQGQLLRAADALLRRREIEAGLWMFRRMARAFDDQPIALANLALALRRIGRAKESEATYRRALRKAPQDPTLWNDFGLFLEGEGRLDEARDAFSESLRHQPAPPTGPAVTNLVVLERRTGAKILPDAVRALSRLLAARSEAALARRLYLDLLLAGQR